MLHGFRSNTLLSGACVYLLLNIVNAAIAFALLPLLTRVLGLVLALRAPLSKGLGLPAQWLPWAVFTSACAAVMGIRFQPVAVRRSQFSLSLGLRFVLTWHVAHKRCPMPWRRAGRGPVMARARLRWPPRPARLQPRGLGCSRQIHTRISATAA